MDNRLKVRWDVKRSLAVGRAAYAARHELMQDLGGEANLSTQEKALVERAVFLRLQLLGHESQIMRGEPSSMTAGEYAQACNTLLGLYRALGLQRRARSLPSLAEYARQAANRTDAAEADPAS